MSTVQDRTPAPIAPPDPGPRAGHRLKSPRAGNGWSRVTGVLLPLLSFVVFIGVWWGSVELFDIRPFFLPSPPSIVDEFLLLPDYLLEQLWITLSEVLQGYAYATIGGLAIAVALSSSALLQRATMPLLVAINSIPKLALAPLLLLWLGFDQFSRVVMVILICFFPIVVSGIAGLSSTPSDLNEVARSLSANRWQHFIKFRFPWALPQIFVGLKVAISLAVVGAVVAEFQGSGKGLGYVIVASGTSANTALAFAAICMLGIMSIVLFYLVVAAERLLLPWAKETTG